MTPADCAQIACVGIALAGTGISAITDLKKHKIRNAVTWPMICIGLLSAGVFYPGALPGRFPVHDRVRLHEPHWRPGRRRCKADDGRLRAPRADYCHADDCGSRRSVFCGCHDSRQANGKARVARRPDDADGLYRSRGKPERRPAARLRHGCLPALCLYWLRFGFFKMEESYETNVSDNGLEKRLFYGRAAGLDDRCFCRGHHCRRRDRVGCRALRGNVT